MDKYYINGKEENGVNYNWQKIKARYNKLGIPEDLYNASYIPLEQNAWNIIMSERSTGKTTNVMLLGLCMRKEYPNSQIVYLRERHEDITKANMNTFFSVINTYKGGEYIRKLTDGQYNHISYNAQERYFYYADIDADTDKERNHSTPVVYCLSADMSDTKRSSLNLPFGDFIIFDEMITESRISIDTVQMFNLIKTIIRERLSPRIICLSNNVSPYSQYLADLEVQHEVMKMGIGDNAEVVTEKGTHIYIELCGLKQSTRKRASNQRFFGFKSGKLASITGGVAWNYDIVPHIKHRKNKQYLTRNLYFEHIYTYRIDTVFDDERGTEVVEIHEVTKPLHDDGSIYYPDSVILTRDRFQLKDARFQMVTNEYSYTFNRLHERGLIYFDNNATHTAFRNFFDI